MPFCPKCGAQNADGVTYCARCGNPVAPAAQGGGPTVVVVGNTAQPPVRSNPGTVWLWLNIVLTVLCCSVLSIIGIVFGAMSTSKFNNGLYSESLSNASTSKVMFIIGLILGILSWVGIIIYVVAMGGLAFLSTLPILLQ